MKHGVGGIMFPVQGLENCSTLKAGWMEPNTGQSLKKTFQVDKDYKGALKRFNNKNLNVLKVIKSKPRARSDRESVAKIKTARCL